jgi:hypothetical protein
VRRQAEVRHLVRKAVDLDPVDPAHIASPEPAAPPSAGRFLRSALNTTALPADNRSARPVHGLLFGFGCKIASSELV